MSLFLSKIVQLVCYTNGNISVFIVNSSYLSTAYEFWKAYFNNTFKFYAF